MSVEEQGEFDQFVEELKRIEKAVYATIAMAILFVFAFFFVATDILYSVFGVDSLGGVPFSHQCAS